MSIIPYSPLQRGLLTGKIKPGHQFNDGDTRKGHKYYQPENVRRINAMLDNIKPIAAKYNATLAQLVINWTTCQPAMDCVLVGARDEAQVLDNVKALSFTLDDADLARIRQEAESLVVVD
jgi:aryl-alcohol dehydrogenase-like predicted oxidoreductase